MPRLTSPRPEESRRKSSTEDSNQDTDPDSQPTESQEVRNLNQQSDQQAHQDSLHLNIPSHSKTPSPQKRSNSKANTDNGKEDCQVVKRGRVVMEQTSPKKKLLHRYDLRIQIHTAAEV